MPPDLKALLEQKSAWQRQHDFRALLKRLCECRALTAEELTLLTDRQKAYLVRKHLTPMIEAQQLEYTIPSMPRHPNQAYRTKPAEEP